jgi:hypothetical protein
MKLHKPIFILALCLICALAFADQKSINISKAEYIDGVYIPVNLQDAWDVLDKSLSKQERKKLLELPEEEMIRFHFSKGMGIRNRWGLWKGSRLAKHFNDLGIHHPDDMSSIILKTFWCHLNEKPINLEQRVAYYKEYWFAHSPPPNDTFPEQNLKEIGAQNYATKRGKYLGNIQIYQNSASGKIWLYENGKWWLVANESFFDKYPHWKDQIKRTP